jgi:hypothetical protein
MENDEVPHTTERIRQILASHAAWLRGEAGGERANLTDGDLTDAYLAGANLAGANLTDAYLADAVIPVIPGIDAAILAAVDQPGASLCMGSWHTCETTHCRAGWAIHLAGAAGKELEAQVGSSAAGALIYWASGSHPVPDFHASNEDAMADMRARAAAAAAVVTP